MILTCVTEDSGPHSVRENVCCLIPRSLDKKVLGCCHVRYWLIPHVLLFVQSSPPHPDAAALALHAICRSIIVNTNIKHWSRFSTLTHADTGGLTHSGQAITAHSPTMTLYLPLIGRLNSFWAPDWLKMSLNSSCLVKTDSFCMKEQKLWKVCC